MKCHLDLGALVEETCFFVTTLEEDGFSPLKLKSKLREEDELKSKLREEDGLNSKETEEDEDSNEANDLYRAVPMCGNCSVCFFILDGLINTIAFPQIPWQMSK
jgi:hypothetical protein